VINLGDSLSGPLLPLDTANYLRATNWIHLAGNHERQLLTLPAERRGPSDAYAHAQLDAPTFAWIASLKHCQPLDDEVFLCHGTPASDVQYLMESVDAQGLRAATAREIDTRVGTCAHAVIACGHTHIPRVMRTARGQLLVNPGSVGLPAYDDEHPFPHRVETGSPDARYAVIEHREGHWQAELIALPYDHAPMSTLAAAQGREDWACALATGFLR
jgi:predicted phosphodiesterase